MADSQMTPAPGIVLVVPEDGERKVGVIAVAGAPGGENVATGRVTAVGPPRGDGDGDLAEMGLEPGKRLHYTKNGAREIGTEGQHAVDHGCILAWE